MNTEYARIVTLKHQRCEDQIERSGNAGWAWIGIESWNKFWDGAWFNCIETNDQVNRCLYIYTKRYEADNAAKISKYTPDS